eukprot:6801162-Lingulodinium_polyedra.AAC.1
MGAPARRPRVASASGRPSHSSRARTSSPPSGRPTSSVWIPMKVRRAPAKSTSSARARKRKTP